ncbi:MAG: TIGR00269 family protein [Nanoarchaeota archaeon]|nr:TIGR00269 family protein [Nanoarchaeota archaeon]
MTCKKCELEPVYKLSSGVKLCKSCFLKYFEKKVRKTIRIYNLIKKGDKVIVAVSGGKDSSTILEILSKLHLKNKIFELVAVSIDEGIGPYRKKTIKKAEKICKKLGIKHYIFSFKKEFGYSLKEIMKKLQIKPCTACGVLRRYLLNKKARELNANKLVIGHNLDDEAQTILMNQFKRKMNLSARLGPLNGLKDDARFIRRIKPLYLMLEKETATYAFLKGLMGSSSICPYSHEAFRDDVKKMLNDFEHKYHGTKNSIITSFLEVLPLLKNKYQTDEPINRCLDCGEATTSDFCQACKILKSLKD